MRKKHGILVEGIVTIRNGDRVITARNHFVDQGLQSLISQLIQNGTNIHYAYKVYTWYKVYNMYIGQDTSTKTLSTRTALVTPIGAAPGTAPNAKSATPRDGAADGIWWITFNATWNAGTVAGTLGEIGLYLGVAPTAGEGIMDRTGFQWHWGWGADVTLTAAMISRLASADLDFSSFVINVANPVTVEWKVQFSFV